MARHSFQDCPDIPCALRSYVKPAHRSQRHGGLPQYACLIAFLHFASKSCRQSAAESMSPEFRCPMLWCRTKFDDLSSVLQHIPVCACLDDGYYWCGECSRPECFMDKGGKIEDPMTSENHGRRDSRMKRASAFFKNLGHGNTVAKQKAKSCGAAARGASSTVLTLGLSSLVEKIRRKHGSERSFSSDKEACGSPSISSSHEDIVHKLSKLDNLEAEDLQQLLDDFDQAQTFNRAEIEIAGLEVLTDDVFDPLPDTTLLSAHETNDVPFAELDSVEPAIPFTTEDNPFSRSVSPFTEINASRPFSPTPISPLPTGLTNDCKYDELALDITDHAISSSVVSLQPCQNSSAASISSQSILLKTCFTPPSNMAPESLDHCTDSSHPQEQLLYQPPDHMTLPAIDRDSQLLENSAFKTTEEKVQEIFTLVSVINREWIDRMTSSPRLLSRCAGLGSQLLFEKGVLGLQQCFRGETPSTFLEVFGLVHIACAVSYTFHRDDNWSRWDELFGDMLSWQNALSKDSDREFYLQALDHLKKPKAPPEGWIKQINPATTSSYKPLSEDPFPGDVVMNVCALPNDISQYLNDLIAPDFAVAMRHGRIMRDCMAFLDDLEQSGLAERNKALLPGHFAWYTRQKEVNITHLSEVMLKPLLTTDGFEALQDIIVDAEFQVKSGLLRTPREIEVALTYGGKLYAQNHDYYERFHQEVSSLCDQAMQNFDPIWRDAYYAADLDKVLAIALETQTDQSEDSNSLPASKSPEVIIQPKRMVRPNPPPRLAIANSITQKRRVPTRSVGQHSPASAESPSTNSSLISSSMDSAATAFSFSTPATSEPPSASSLSSLAKTSAPLSCSSFNFMISPTSTDCDNFTISPTVLDPSPSQFHLPPTVSAAFAAPKTTSVTSHPATKSTTIRTSSSSAAGDPGVTYCPSCPAKFTGNFQYRRSNLRRHLRTTSKHGGSSTEGPKCPEEGCGKIFSRTDNLALHMQRAHGAPAGADEDEMAGAIGAGVNSEYVGPRSKRRRWTQN